ncbi:MAG: tetratricopeptide repeat protein [Thermoanaerobacteraceae bacterium]|nr:tetratricopeptide repeat protein [Thermoanaerobacteraceae bacterium]
MFWRQLLKGAIAVAQAEKDGEKRISLKLSIFLIVLSVLIIALAGMQIGKMFFWDQYEETTKLDRDLEIALDNVERDPNNVDYRVALGWVYFQRGQVEEAIREYKNALKLEPENMRAKFNLASAYIENGNLEDARLLMEEYVKKNPLHASGYSILGLIYSELGEYEKAISNFKESIRISPGNTNVYYQLGIAYEKAGDVDKAREYYQKTLEYNPNFKQARKALERLGNHQ